jgi:polyhydroxyalkanoate synthase
MGPKDAPNPPPSAAVEDYLRVWQRLFSYADAFGVAQQTRVGTTPCDVVYERGTHRLMRYRRSTTATWNEPVLFCYALVNRPYILDLQPEKSIVRHYLARGFDVYMIDWGVPAHGDRVLTLEHYVCGFLREAVDWVLANCARSNLHLLGYCMGGTLAALAAALRPDTIKTLTLLAAPIDFSDKETLLSIWTEKERFDVDAFVDAHGNCPAWFLQTCFLLLKPVENILEKNLALFENVEDPRFLANYFAVELWLNDNIPVAGETFRRFVKDLYQSNRLVRGEFELEGQRVDLGRVTCPLLMLTAKRDHLVPPSSTEGIRPRVASRDVKSVVFDAGHVGLVVGSKAQRTLWPKATRWLAARSTSSQAHVS